MTKQEMTKQERQQEVNIIKLVYRDSEEKGLLFREFVGILERDYGITRPTQKAFKELLRSEGVEVTLTNQAKEEEKPTLVEESLTGEVVGALEQTPKKEVKKKTVVKEAKKVDAKEPTKKTDTKKTDAKKELEQIISETRAKDQENKETILKVYRECKEQGKNLTVVTKELESKYGIKVTRQAVQVLVKKEKTKLAKESGVVTEVKEVKEEKPQLVSSFANKTPIGEAYTSVGTFASKETVDKRTVHRYNILGLTHKTIASLTGIPSSTVVEYLKDTELNEKLINQQVKELVGYLNVIINGDSDNANTKSVLIKYAHFGFQGLMEYKGVIYTKQALEVLLKSAIKEYIEFQLTKVAKDMRKTRISEELLKSIYEETLFNYTYPSLEGEALATYKATERGYDVDATFYTKVQKDKLQQHKATKKSNTEPSLTGVAKDEPTKPKDEPTKPKDEPTKPKDEPTKTEPKKAEPKVKKETHKKTEPKKAKETKPKAKAESKVKKETPKKAKPKSKAKAVVQTDAELDASLRDLYVSMGFNAGNSLIGEPKAEKPSTKKKTKK